MLRRPYLRATAFVIALGFFMQITGVNAIVYYSPRLFDAMGFRGNFALLVLPAMVQAAALAAVLVAVVMVDRLGRHPVLLSGIGTMIAADVLLIVVFAAGLAAIFGFIGVLLFTMAFTFAFVYRFAPETKGRQLEEIRHFWENNGRWPDELPSATTDVRACR
jgi:MFS transporter, SP family, galactose:H+ symporter